MATGSPKLAYFKNGLKYQYQLWQQGLCLDVVVTGGSNDNLRRLDQRRGSTELKPGQVAKCEASPDNRKYTDDGKLGQPELEARSDAIADVALIQGGFIQRDDPAIASLGTVFYEGVWVFRRRAAAHAAPRRLHAQAREAIAAAACQPVPPPRPARHGIFHHPPREGINGLRGLTIAVGTNDSGVQPLACELLKRHGITVRGVADLTGRRDAITGIKDGSVDAVFIVAAADAEDVRDLLSDPGIELVGFPQADAYADQYPYLNKVTLHRGAIDLANDQPPADVPLIAAKASLIVRSDVPFNIQYMLLKAARQIHTQHNSTILQGNDVFPSSEASRPPLSPEAQQFYKPSLPYFVTSAVLDHLPFWLGGPVSKALFPVILALGALTFVGPLMRVIPVLYNFATQRPVMRLLLDVMELETKLLEGKQDVGTITRQLKELDQQTSRRLRRRVPATLAVPLLILRQHIDALRRRLEQVPNLRDGDPPGPGRLT